MSKKTEPITLTYNLAIPVGDLDALEKGLLDKYGSLAIPVGDLDALEKNSLFGLLDKYGSKVCTIEEQETPKYPNGSVVFAPKYRTIYHYNSEFYGVSKHTWQDGDVDQKRLMSQELFLDEEKANSSIKLENRHKEIVNKVYAINAENNWVADWEDYQQAKYCSIWKHRVNSIKFNYNRCQQIGGVIYYCEEAQDYLKTLTIEDQKAFLKIYN